MFSLSTGTEERLEIFNIDVLDTDLLMDIPVPKEKYLLTTVFEEPFMYP